MENLCVVPHKESPSKAELQVHAISDWKTLRNAINVKLELFFKMMNFTENPNLRKYFIR
jgi:hypothetical protein